MNPESLCSRILMAKYCSEGTILDAIEGPGIFFLFLEKHNLRDPSFETRHHMAIGEWRADQDLGGSLDSPGVTPTYCTKRFNNHI